MKSMGHKIKLIGFDLDGTLLTSDKRLTERTWEAMERAAERGMMLVPVTGRPLSGMPDEILTFPGIHYVISANGARILKDGRTIDDHLMPAEEARKILDIFGEYDTMREIYFDGQGYADASRLENISRYMPFPAMAQYFLSTRKPVRDVMETFEEENAPVDKVQALFAHDREREEARRRIEQIPGMEVSGSIGVNIEVNMSGINKGIALEKLAGRLGIRMEEILAFGDGDNDIPMLKMAGIGAAMENGMKEVKAAADIIVESNDEDGVAKTIERLLQGEEVFQARG